MIVDRASALDELLELMAERIVREAVARQAAAGDRGIIPPPTEAATDARRAVRPVLVRPAAADVDR